jgi:hypothetical protein
LNMIFVATTFQGAPSERGRNSVSGGKLIGFLICYMCNMCYMCYMC